MSHEISQFLTSLFPLLYLTVFGFIALLWALLLTTMLQLNVLLMLFNLLPLHPLDGGKILAAFLPARLDHDGLPPPDTR